MPVFNTRAALSAHLQGHRAPSVKVGLVPTMGALHRGHISLLERSISENGITVATIFVNPTQFNNADDLQKYPRTLEADVAKIEALRPDIVVFAPSVDEMYDGHTVSEHFDFDGLENQMEGRFRPGHFDGVGTIVKKLFEIVAPDNAYFGEKDFQQLQIIRKLVSKHNIPVSIVGCPIYREKNGLAMSSRNERLADHERASASVIYETLLEAKMAAANRSIPSIADMVRNRIEAVPGFEMEYFEIADEATLEPAKILDHHHRYRAFIAVFVNNIRLIDTISLN